MNKKILLIGLIIIVISMSIGYALYSTSLKVKGTGNIDSNFNIEVTGITEDKKEGKAVSITNPTYTKTSATFNTKLSREKDNIEYKVEITNKGSIDGKIENITITNPNELIKVETRGIEKGQIIKSGEVLEYIVRVYIPEGTKINEDITSKIEVNTEIIQDDNQIFNEPIDGIEANKLEIESTIEESEYTGIKCTVNAKGNGLRYSYSLDDKTYTEPTESNTYTFTGLKPNTRYTVYYKVEDKDGNYVTDSKWITTKDITNSIIKVENENTWTRDKKVTINYPEVEGSKYYYKIDNNEYIEATNPKELIVEENTTIYAKIEKDGNVTEVSKEVTKIDNTEPSLNITTVNTSSSISIAANSNDNESGIEKYEYSINNGDYIESKYNVYKFINLNQDTEYIIKVKVINKVGLTNEIETKVETKSISAPTYKISPEGELYSQEKVLTVVSQCEACTDEYSIDNGTTWNEFPSKEFKIKFLSARDIIARSTDGINVVTSTYKVTNIDSTPSGIVKINSTNTVPDGYLPCDGRAVSRTTYANLFKAIGTTYGSGDGSTSFNLPNYNGKVLVGKDSGTFNALGKTGGSENTTLTISNIPSHAHTVTAKGTVSSTFTGSSVATNSNGAHTHTLSAYFQNANSYMLAEHYNNLGFRGSEGNVAKATSSNGDHQHTLTAKGTVSSSFTGSSATTNSVGSGTSFTNLQPYIVENYIIKY